MKDCQTGHLEFALLDEGIARILLYNEENSPNILNKTTMKELTEATAEVITNKAIRAAFCISGKVGSRELYEKKLPRHLRKPDRSAQMGYGADVFQIFSMKDNVSAAAAVSVFNKLFNAIEKSPKPFIAGWEGLAIGGVAEWLVAMHYLIAASNSIMVWPEVGLGIFPGAGLSQRLTRILYDNLPYALEIILQQKSVYARQALAAGIIHEMIEPKDAEGLSYREKEDALSGTLYDTCLKRAKKAAVLAEFDPSLLKRTIFSDYGLVAYLKREAKEIAPREVRERLEDDGLKYNDYRKKPPLMNRLLSKPFFRPYLFARAERQVKKTFGDNLPAPYKAIQAIREGLCHEGELCSTKVEEPEVAELLINPTAKILQSVFFQMEAMKKERGRATRRHAPELPKNIGIIGVGEMGGDIAIPLIRKNPELERLYLKDINPRQLSIGKTNIEKALKKDVERRIIASSEAEALSKKIVCRTENYDGFENCDFVYLVVSENAEIYQQVLAEVEAVNQGRAVIVSNTSSFITRDIAADSRYPDKFAIAHDFKPADKSKAVEISGGEKTSPETVAYLLNIVHNAGKLPIMTKDSPGQFVNRYNWRTLLEAFALFEEGAAIEVVDRLMRQFGTAAMTGRPMGIYELLDFVTQGVMAGMIPSMSRLGPKYNHSTRVLLEMANHNKQLPLDGDHWYEPLTFFDYSEGRPRDPEKLKVHPKIGELRGWKSKRFTEEEILNRLLTPQVDDMLVCLDEGIVGLPRDANVASILTVGFPPWLGGIHHWAENILTFKKCYEIMLRLQNKLGDKFAPSDALKRAALRKNLVVF